MIPLFKVRMSPDITSEIAPTLNSGFITQGPRVDELEEVALKELNVPNEPVAVNSATSAIDLALDLAGIGPGDEVISTPMTCFATNVSALRRGAKIKWADVYPHTGNINVFDVERIATDKTKAILAVNWAGQFAEYDALKLFAPAVIEDAAHTWDTFDHSRSRGDYIAYSLQAIKFLTAGDGGLLVTPEETHKLARMKRWYGLDRDNNESFRASQDIQTVGTKYNMNDISASIALANMIYAKNSVKMHRMNARALYDGLADLEWLSVPPHYDDTSYWIFPLVVGNGVDRDDFEEYLKHNGIQAAQVHFRNDKYTITKQFDTRTLPGLDFFSSHQTNIPCGWWLNSDDVERIINVIKDYPWQKKYQ